MKYCEKYDSDIWFNAFISIFLFFERIYNTYLQEKRTTLILRIQREHLFS